MRQEQRSCWRKCVHQVNDALQLKAYDTSVSSAAFQHEASLMQLRQLTYLELFSCNHDCKERAVSSMASLSPTRPVCTFTPACRYSGSAATAAADSSMWHCLRIWSVLGCNPPRASLQLTDLTFCVLCDCAGGVDFADFDQPVYPTFLPSECSNSSSSECGSSTSNYWGQKAVRVDRVWAKLPAFGGVAVQGAVLDMVRMLFYLT
jgi:hypothetical protein